jgi:hypothetical protein
MGYGGWSLFFSPRIIDGVLSLALGFADKSNPFERYKKVVDYLKDHGAYESTQRLFEEH